MYKNMLTVKYFEDFAFILRKNILKYGNNDTVDGIIKDLEDYFLNDNPNFDKIKFRIRIFGSR